jgi:hypothetical protein
MEKCRHGDMDTWIHGHGDMETWIHGYMDMETWRHGHGDVEISNKKRKTEAQAFFLNLFTACLLYKWQFIICPFVEEEINGSYPF